MKSILLFLCIAALGACASMFEPSNPLSAEQVAAIKRECGYHPAAGVKGVRTLAQGSYSACKRRVLDEMSTQDKFAVED